MRFLADEHDAAFHERLHPEVRELVLDLEDWSQENALPEVVVTSVLRTWGAQYSWHKVAAAVDLRSKHYNPRQKAAVMEWLKRRCAEPLEWECFEHDSGNGLHIHLARRDQDWRAAFGAQVGNA